MRFQIRLFLLITSQYFRIWYFFYFFLFDLFAFSAQIDLLRQYESSGIVWWSYRYFGWSNLDSYLLLCVWLLHLSERLHNLSRFFRFKKHQILKISILYWLVINKNIRIWKRIQTPISKKLTVVKGAKKKERKEEYVGKKRQKKQKGEKREKKGGRI